MDTRNIYRYKDRVHGGFYEFKSWNFIANRQYLNNGFIYIRRCVLVTIENVKAIELD